MDSNFLVQSLAKNKAQEANQAAEAIEDAEQKQEVITQSEKAIATIETAIDVTLDATVTEK